jgi:hypothetical protein
LDRKLACNGVLLSKVQSASGGVYLSGWCSSSRDLPGAYDVFGAALNLMKSVAHSDHRYEYRNDRQQMD